MSSYLLRGATLAMSEFVLVYLITWTAVALSSLCKSRRVSPRSTDLIYALLLAPFVTSSFVVIAFAIPSFLRFEPTGGEEELGPVLIVLTLLCVVLLANTALRVASALFRTWRFTARWHGHSTYLGDFAGVPAFRIPDDAPPLTVTGLLRPTVYISSVAMNLLSEPELSVAIQHEVAHARRHDNLRKLIMRCCSLIPAPALERRWLELIEIDSDSAAVSNHDEALDLASALVKASRFSAASPDLAMPFATHAEDQLRTRIERLLSWTSPAPRSHVLIVCSTMFLLAGCLLLMPFYPTLLVAIHEFSEMLVRCL